MWWRVSEVFECHRQDYRVTKKKERNKSFWDANNVNYKTLQKSSHAVVVVIWADVVVAIYCL